MIPTKISSLILPINILLTIYSGNYILLITEIPIATTSILHHHKLISNIHFTDVIVAHYAFWQHMYYAYYYSIASVYIYSFGAILFAISGIYKYKQNIQTS